MITTDWLIAIGALITALATAVLAIFNILNLREIRRIQRESVKPHLVLRMFQWTEGPLGSPKDNYMVHIENLGKWYATNLRGKLSFPYIKGGTKTCELTIRRDRRLNIDEVGIAPITFSSQTIGSPDKQIYLEVEYDGISESNLVAKLNTTLNEMEHLNYREQQGLLLGRNEIRLGETIIDLATF